MSLCQDYFGVALKSYFTPCLQGDSTERKGRRVYTVKYGVFVLTLKMHRKRSIFTLGEWWTSQIPQKAPTLMCCTCMRGQSGNREDRECRHNVCASTSSKHMLMMSFCVSSGEVLTVLPFYTCINMGEECVLRRNLSLSRGLYCSLFYSCIVYILHS